MSDVLIGILLYMAIILALLVTAWFVLFIAAIVSLVKEYRELALERKRKLDEE